MLAVTRFHYLALAKNTNVSFVITVFNCQAFKLGLANTQAGFILERGLAGFPQFGKKCRIKFTLPRQMGRRKNRPQG